MSWHLSIDFDAIDKDWDNVEGKNQFRFLHNPATDETKFWNGLNDHVAMAKKLNWMNQDDWDNLMSGRKNWTDWIPGGVISANFYGNGGGGHSEPVVFYGQKDQLPPDFQDRFNKHLESL